MKFLLKITLPLILIGFGPRSLAQDDIHCLPLAESRIIHEMAFKKLIQDSLLTELSGKVGLLETENTRIYRDFTALLASERTKTSLANQVSQQQKLISQSHEKENKELRKKNRSLKWQRNIAVFLALFLAAVTIVN